MPGRWNDKTVVRFDGFVNDIFRGLLYADVKYKLSSSAGEWIEYCGAWLLVDGGYLPWSCTICPLKSTSSIKETRWSKWAESMRKDVECTFGILKGRWRILKTGIRLQSLSAVDDVWFTCCALHNMLLNIDGLDIRWNEGVKSPYEGEMGWHENGVVEHNVPLIFSRVNGGLNNVREYDETMSHDKIPIAYGIGDMIDEFPANNIKSIRKISFKSFRLILINHFQEKWLRNEVVWPSRTGVVELL
jgi:hypothetical protein